MKNRPNKNIPDFSRKKAMPMAPPGADARVVKPPPPPQGARNIKPQSTSSKSGRRGT